MEESDKPSFTKQMRKATREIHDVSDHLVNAKLGFALTDDAVWAEGLLTFYEIFKYLEGAMERLSHTLIGELDVEGMRRTKAFEDDLHFYYGKDWLVKEYKPSEEVSSYLEYLTKLEAEDPLMLAAYIYHIYVGLFSGGQILRRKRALEVRLKMRKGDKAGKGESVTDFGDIPIHKLKKQMVDAMEHIAETLGEEDRRKLIEESKNVFRFNNLIVRGIKGANQAIMRKIWNFTLIAVPTVLAVYFGSRLIGSHHA